MWPDEFQRYLDLFVKYLPKTPFHARTVYDGGFIRQKGRKKDGEEFCRGCYPAVVAKMLDYERWKRIRGMKGDRRGNRPIIGWPSIRGRNPGSMPSISTTRTICWGFHPATGRMRIRVLAPWSR